MANNFKNIIFLGRKAGSITALEYLFSQGLKIKLIVFPEESISRANARQLAMKHRVPFFTDDQKVYELIKDNSPLVNDVDLVISFLFPKKIKYPLIKLGQLGCINFHPAPLPDYKGRAGYNTAILAGKRNFGCSAHFIDTEKWDSGPIIKVKRFSFTSPITAWELETKTQAELVKLFKQVIDMILTGRSLPQKANQGGLYLTKEQLEGLKLVNPERESLAEINRKIMAFFFPPYSGAKIKIHGQEFTIINEQILQLVNKLINRNHE